MKPFNFHCASKSIAAVIISLGIMQSTSAQGIAVNGDGSPPDSSAMLDVQSTTGGFLMPRMTTEQREAIDSPAVGLMVYDTDTNGFWCFAGPEWIKVMAGYTEAMQDADGDTNVQVEENPDEDIIRFNVAGTERWVMSRGDAQVRLHCAGC